MQDGPLGPWGALGAGLSGADLVDILRDRRVTPGEVALAVGGHGAGRLLERLLGPVLDFFKGLRKAPEEQPRPDGDTSPEKPDQGLRARPGEQPYGPPGMRPGLIDESASAFSTKERRIAELLSDEGYEVRKIPESDVKTSDAGIKTAGDPNAIEVEVEFKSLDPGATDASVKNRLSEAGRKPAPHAIIDGRGSGLTRELAEHGIRRFLGADPTRFDSIRVIGDNFELIHSAN